MKWSKRTKRSIIIIIVIFIIILFELKEILAQEGLVSPCPVSVVASMDSRERAVYCRSIVVSMVLFEESRAMTMLRCA